MTGSGLRAGDISGIGVVEVNGRYPVAAMA